MTALARLEPRHLTRPVARGIDVTTTLADFAPLYARLAGQDPIPADAVLDGDAVL